MEKASGGSFARTTRKTAEDEGDDEDDWEMTLNTLRRVNAGNIESVACCR